MCEPTTLAVMSIGVQAFGALQSASAANHAVDVNQSAILNNYNAQVSDIAAIREEVNDDADIEKSEIAIQALRDKGKARVASSEANALGLTADLLLQDVETQAGRSTSYVELSRKRKQMQLSREKEGLDARTQGALNVNQTNSVSALEVLGDVGNIALSGLSKIATKKTDDGDK
jgi:hypothetical protein